MDVGAISFEKLIRYVVAKILPSILHLVVTYATPMGDASGWISSLEVAVKPHQCFHLLKAEHLLGGIACLEINQCLPHRESGR